MTSIATTSGLVPLPPCPAWCVLPADHDLDDVDRRDFDGTVYRTQVASEWTVTTGDGHPARIVVEQTLMVGPGVDPDPEELAITFTDAPTRLSVAQAREVVGQLLLAAGHLQDLEAFEEGR